MAKRESRILGRRGGGWIAAVICASGIAATAARGAATDPADDIEAQYESAVAALKKPAVGGVLVTEVGPESAAAAAGLRGGDIITEYYGTRITTLQTLREQIAEAVARRLDDPASGNRVLARVRRGTDEKLLQVPREALDIRAVEVEANVAGPRNPPPNSRGTLTLNWGQAAEALQHDGKAGTVFRSFERTQRAGGAANEEWIGWQTCVIAIAADEESLTGTVQWHRITQIPDDLKVGQVPPNEQTTVTFHLALGDYKSLPAFVLDEVTAHYPGEQGSTITATGKRLGERLQASITVNAAAPSPHENAAPLNAIPQPALPWVAAALPHEKDAALGVNLLSLRDLQSRPGYVLVARGLDAMPADPAEVPATAPTTVAATIPASTAPAAAAEASRAWRVDLVHLGVVIESYWFSEQRSLLLIEAQGANAVVSRRTVSLDQASLPMERKAASRPAAAGATQP